MKFKFDKKYLYLTISLTITFCLAITFYYVLFHGVNILNSLKKIIVILLPVIDGLVISYFLSPVLNKIETNLIQKLFILFHTDIENEKIKKKIRLYSVSLTIIIFLLFLGIMVQTIVPQVISSVTTLASNMPGYIETAEHMWDNYLSSHKEIADLINNNEAITSLTQKADEWVIDQFRSVPSMVGKISSTAVSTIKIFSNFILGLIISIYLMSSKENFKAQVKRIIYALLSKDKAESFFIEVMRMHKIFGGFFIGKLVDSLIIGIICFIGCCIMKTPYSILISVIVGVTNMIPYFGPFIGAVPSALLILLADPKKCLYFVIFVIILQQVDGNIIGPKILGSSTGLSSFSVVFAIIIFGGIFGVLGMFIGVPLFAYILNAFNRLLDKKLAQKEMPVDTDAYLKPGRIDSVAKEK